MGHLLLQGGLLLLAGSFRLGAFLFLGAKFVSEGGF